MSRVNIEIDEATLKGLICDHLSKILGSEVVEKDVKIQVKSKQNYRAEWETAQFRAWVDKII